ncbi:MAG: Clp protease N-terminal domain-containing protein [Gemmatimonadaceae bacterium]
MEDTFYAAAIAIIVGAAAAHSFIWTWVWLRKSGLIEPTGKRVRALESRIDQLEADNTALELQVERLGEAQRFTAKLAPPEAKHDSPASRPHGFNFTQRCRTVLAMAREESARLHNDYVGTEHILLGLLREGQGVAVAVLRNLNVDLDELRQKTEQVVKNGKPSLGVGLDLPYTSRAKKVLDLATSEARDLDHTYLGTEHLLLGILREEKGVAAQVLNKAGVNLNAARAGRNRLPGR